MTTAELDQRMSALQQANVIRVHRARLKEHLATGHLTVAEILRSEDGRLDTMRLRDLLLATPCLGQSKVRRILDAHHLSPTLTLVNLGASRREQLLCFIAANHPKVPVS